MGPVAESCETMPGAWPTRSPLHRAGRHLLELSLWCPMVSPPHTWTVLTQDGEACRPGPDGGLDGLALVHGVIL